MKQFILSLCVAAVTLGTLAQSPAKPAGPKTSARPATTSSGIKLPPGVPPVHSIVKTAFSLRYQDIRIGAGAEAEPDKMYKVNYTGWIAADGRKFDSSYDHKSPVIGKDGKPELDADGKPKMNEGQPISFPQGFGRVIPGFDQGFAGMRIGGKRRLFIPWQLAYGARGRPGPNADNPGIPPKADLIFDVELVEVTDLQMPQGHPGLSQPIHPQTPGTPASPTTPGTPPPSTAPAPSANPANPTAPPPAGTPPPTNPQTPPHPEKPQAN